MTIWLTVGDVLTEHSAGDQSVQIIRLPAPGANFGALGSENISAPYFKQFFFRGGGGITPPDGVKHHASQSQDRNNKYFILYIEFCINNKI